MDNMNPESFTGDSVPFELVKRINRDVIRGTIIATDQARFLVDIFYQTQKFRITVDNQIAAMRRDDENEPHETLDYLSGGYVTLEKSIAQSLQWYVETRPEWAWLSEVKGIGPITSAGLLAHLDITKAPTAGAFWRFAGLDPSQEWGKGQKRPFNARLKALCAYKIPESFKKVSGREDAYYGHAWRQYKNKMIEDNEAGRFAEAARQIAEDKPRHAQVKTYAEGRLPPGHLDARARRWVGKLFLSHLHHVMYEIHYGKPPPKPYVIEHGGHAHYEAPPHWPQ